MIEIDGGQTSMHAGRQQQIVVHEVNDSCYHCRIKKTAATAVVIDLNFHIRS
jgi:pSer/pThr/pTyr-binding forkhead associated (FHA) protein